MSIKTNNQVKAIEEAAEACKNYRAFTIYNDMSGEAMEAKYVELSNKRIDALMEVAELFGLDTLQQAMDIVTACVRYSNHHQD